MSSDFTAAEAALKTWFRRGSGLTQVLMRNEARPRVNAQWGEISIQRMVTVGSDTTRYVNRFPVVYCERRLTITLAVESDSQTSSIFALVPITRLQALAETDRMIAALKSGGLVYESGTEIVQADYELDENWISRYEMTVSIRWGFEVTISNPDDEVGPIEHVLGTGNLSGKSADYRADKPGTGTPD
jgi:hypothetical protein